MSTKMNKTQLKRGMWVTINAGSLKGAMGKIKRVDQEKSEVLIQIGPSSGSGTYRTYRISWNDVDLYKVGWNTIDWDKINKKPKK